MSRLTDTRQLTRETADKLLAAGRPAQELTVDAIYAEIRQGSRSTINDELKRWKEDQTRADGVSTDLPPPVAQAMRELWAQAVAQGEALFETQRAQLQASTQDAQRQQEQAEQALSEARAQIALLQVQQQHAQAKLAEQEQALVEQGARCTQLQEVQQALQTQLQAQREASRQQQEVERQAHEQALAEERRKLAEQEAGWRADMAQAAERLEAVQRHVMLQVSEAREAQKRAEQNAAAASHRSERLATELEALRLQSATQGAQLVQANQAKESTLAAHQTLGQTHAQLQERHAQLQQQLAESQQALLALKLAAQQALPLNTRAEARIEARAERVARRQARRRA